MQSGESTWVVEDRSTTQETRARLDPPPAAAPAASEPADEPEPERSCCRMCHKGKACGNTCIARDRTCHTAPGCACDE